MATLTFTSIQAPNANALCRRITAYVGACLSTATEFVDDIPWQERERLLDDGEIAAGWICGLPYVRKADRDEPPVELLAAPVMAAARYADRPLYFSDVIVRRESPYQNFAALRGVTWAYNEPNSQSGYNITRYHLACLGQTGPYFDRVVAAGSHQAALAMVLDGRVEASAIDSTVLETEMETSPGLCGRLRVIDVLGPSPIPPWVVSRHVAPGLRERLRAAMLDMDHTTAGREVLAAGRIRRFARVVDSDYDSIRTMARLAERVTLE